MTVLFLLLHDCQGVFLIYSFDFDVPTGRARMYFNMTSQSEKLKM